MTPDPIATLSRPRLLVIDDDRDFVEALCEWVERHSHWDARGACDVEDAVAQAGARHPDAIVLDLHMAHADARDTADRLDRASGPEHPPVLGLTGDPDLQVAAASDVHFDASMLKPPDLEGLLDWLEARPRSR
jgi:DNA-binding response OmpR family regulator